jgi:hypothetical protein
LAVLGGVGLQDLRDIADLHDFGGGADFHGDIHALAGIHVHNYIVGGKGGESVELRVSV